VSGWQLLAALENGFSQVESGGGRFPQISGMRVTYDPSAEPGQRVRDIVIGETPINLDANYTLATIDFLANGGDGYSMLRDAQVLIPPTGGPVQAALLLDYLAANGVVRPVIEGRIAALGDMPASP
jgi:5'-nucleotidase/UDP-sugar diphosphatase